MIEMSVCCCTWNRPEYLEELIHSWLIQTYPMEKRELVILDDAGQYGNMRGAGWQIVSFSRRFATLGEKRNACVSLTHPESKSIVVADDDDIYLPHWLECHARNFSRGAKWSFASSIFWSERNHIVRKWNYENEGWIMHPAHAFNKQLFWDVGGYPRMAWMEDHFFFEKLRERNIEHINALDEDEIPFLICRRNMSPKHIHTTGMSLEQYQKMNAEIDFITDLKIGWKKDYLLEVQTFLTRTV